MWLSALCTNACEICLSTCGYDAKYHSGHPWTPLAPPLDASCSMVDEVCGATNRDLACRHLNDAYNWIDLGQEDSWIDEESAYE